METVYKVEYEGSYCVLFTLEDALELIKTEVKEYYDIENQPLDFKLTVCEMKSKDIESLPEFDGF